MSISDLRKASSQRWVTPQLVVITRQRPQEAVLLACKIASQSGDVNEQDAKCMQDFTCMACSSEEGS